MTATVAPNADPNVPFPGVVRFDRNLGRPLTSTHEPGESGLHTLDARGKVIPIPPRTSGFNAAIFSKASDRKKVEAVLAACQKVIAQNNTERLWADGVTTGGKDELERARLAFRNNPTDATRLAYIRAFNDMPPPALQTELRTAAFEGLLTKTIARTVPVFKTALELLISELDTALQTEKTEFVKEQVAAGIAPTGEVSPMAQTITWVMDRAQRMLARVEKSTSYGELSSIESFLFRL